ncbi:unnamed protein product [Linum trigynum]|uniref:Uncharacterized protein n=1 Tax=Linum trigynum TaxID=586398 RepID=A0AAV2EIE6_9ROSI
MITDYHPDGDESEEAEYDLHRSRHRLGIEKRRQSDRGMERAEKGNEGDDEGVSGFEDSREEEFFDLREPSL